MSKITFRADDDLIRQLEEYDASKSEVMREALRAYLGEDGETGANGPENGVNEGVDAQESLDDLVAERVDAVLADRLEGAFTPQQPQDVNVNITLDGDGAAVGGGDDAGRKTGADEREPAAEEPSNACKQCGEQLSDSDVYCSNCGEKASHRVFCECGDELRSDWGFCPSCGRRTPAADVLHDS
ncbi:zinc-ribbon domain-containing protein [Natronomonas salina]|uniref:double zinc ribbon domain-containing protein n=1 Tax=Natronomonas salina TaxID=1710540 RepID=UPI0015B3840A|nr:zinc ribbon domain-containing protein [Natronomonas salina]QLD90157.1 zinc-ribbon domain-containing protein [Natronomonas salina]